MALAKMAGLDVTPPRPSASTMRWSSPPVMRLARMKSSHTDWPYVCREASGFAAADERTLEVPITSPSGGPGGPRLLFAVARLYGLDLRQAPRVPFVGRVAGLHEGLHQLVGEGGTDDASAQDEDVHVVVLDALVRRVDVVADGGADAGDLVGGHAGAHSAAADEHGPLRAPVLHGQGHLLRVVGIIDGRGRVRAHVDHVVSLLAKGLRHLLLQREAGVVGPDGHLHRFFLPAHLAPSCSRAAATTFSGWKPNFFCSSLRGAEAPNVRMPIF